MVCLQLWPEKFQNKTNGVTPRRWIRFCNPVLSRIITKWTGTEEWVTNTEQLAILRKVKSANLTSLTVHVTHSTNVNCQQFADNEDLQSEWREAKRRNKIKVASFIKEKTGYIVSPDAMFDVQVISGHYSFPY